MTTRSEEQVVGGVPTKGDSWSVDAAPLVARALVEGLALPAVGDELPDAPTRRLLRRRYGCFSWDLATRGSDFGSLLRRSVSDDSALCTLVGPLLGAGLLAVERGRRRAVLSTLPSSLASTVKRGFEVERAKGELPMREREAAAEAWLAAARLDEGPRPAVCRRLGLVLGDRWLDELRLLAAGSVDVWQLPVVEHPGREGLLDWWMGRRW